MIFDQVTDSNCSLIIGRYFKRAKATIYKHRQKFACKVENCNVPSVHSPQNKIPHSELSSDDIRINHYFNAHYSKKRNLPKPIERFDDSMKRFVTPLMEKLNLAGDECPLSKSNSENGQ
jgi:hypothetical protein